MTVEVVRAAALARIAHGFLGRAGGVSTGPTAGLDMGRRGLPPTPELIENQRRALAAVAPDTQLVTAYQIHSAEAVVVAEPWPDDARPHADALVTDRSGITLGILTADCAPVLFADGAAGVVGAAHAGWKGAIGGVTDATIAAMEQLGATRANIAAAVGPCIARASYEVDDAFLARFTDADPANERFFAPGRAGHHQFDLEAYVAHRLAAAGLVRIEMLGEDTYSQPDRFYSFRRATHRAEANYGRQISLISLGS
ncbi:peptidoglycan editing factor PgeF [Sphingomonas turrisvirgatae]|uniref:Purine nucleoside phosphorylase n=1 Tax=Sphingomonas turrisvirgatae TaxID=1888892 RepID=A0A1E3LS76_9SPHN|nr:peptidoglycan editing factor PgeF [Sphingomonas turrisvirgatae]ODP36607.1 polyphenol oxidase [Sphingomonas turrisvirgatae]